MMSVELCGREKCLKCFESSPLLFSVPFINLPAQVAQIVSNIWTVECCGVRRVGKSVCAFELEFV